MGSNNDDARRPFSPPIKQTNKINEEPGDKVMKHSVSFKNLENNIEEVEEQDEAPPLTYQLSKGFSLHNREDSTILKSGINHRTLEDENPFGPAEERSTEENLFKQISAPHNRFSNISETSDPISALKKTNSK